MAAHETHTFCKHQPLATDCSKSGSCSLTVNIFQTLVSSIVQRKIKRKSKHVLTFTVVQKCKTCPWCSSALPDEHRDKPAEPAPSPGSTDLCLTLPALTPHHCHSNTITPQHSQKMTKQLLINFSTGQDFRVTQKIPLDQSPRPCQPVMKQMDTGLSFPPGKGVWSTPTSEKTVGPTNQVF